MTDRTRPPWGNLPHGDTIDALLDELRDLTDAEVEALVAARDATLDAPWVAARNAAWNAARIAGRSAAWGAAWGSVRSAVWDAALDAALDAARALVVADLVGQYGLTRGHLDVLTGPARTVPRLSTIIDRAPPPTYH